MTRELISGGAGGLFVILGLFFFMWAGPKDRKYPWTCPVCKFEFISYLDRVHALENALQHIATVHLEKK